MANDETQANWSYNPNGGEHQQEQGAEQSETVQDSQKTISWTASEYVANQKDAKWYFGFFLFLIICVGLVYFFTKDLISVVAIAVIGILFSVLANKKPKQLAYEINSQGISISGRFYNYSEFKSFSLSSEGVIGAINLMPLKRFMPEISIYFPPEQGEAIISVLTAQLPHEQRAEHGVDKLTKRFKF
ncbi:hypothetical protein HZB74_03835 [Candidatus Saccharibacteria bacterium]|nr:hypothetical protein [Candidatus Saccharibacteria bacterium]